MDILIILLSTINTLFLFILTALYGTLKPRCSVCRTPLTDNTPPHLTTCQYCRPPFRPYLLPHAMKKDRSAS